MAKQRGNPDWGKPDPTPPVTTVRRPSRKSLGNYVCLQRITNIQLQLKAWVQKNKDQKYVPSDLLRAWNFEVKGDL